MSSLRHSNPPDTSIRARSAVESLVIEIRGLIDSQMLRVGDALPSERELCERFSTSRNTVREAMRMLKAYGVVEISRKTFADIQGFRSLIEVNSVDAMFDNLRDDDLAALDAANAAMGNAVSLDQASEADFQFHVALVSILDNAALIELYRIMKPVIIRIMQRGKSRQDFHISTFEQHKAVIDALRARDRISYQYALQHHLNIGFGTFAEQC